MKQLGYGKTVLFSRYSQSSGEERPAKDNGSVTSSGMRESGGHRRTLDGQCQVLGGSQATGHLN